MCVYVFLYDFIFSSLSLCQHTIGNDTVDNKSKKSADCMCEKHNNNKNKSEM